MPRKKPPKKIEAIPPTPFQPPENPLGEILQRQTEAAEEYRRAMDDASLAPLPAPARTTP